MPPYDASVIECTGVLNECDAETVDGALDKNVVGLKHANERELKLCWPNIIFFTLVHLSAVYGLWLLLTSAKIYTTLFAFALYILSGLGVTAGAHRLWSHRGYKAKLPLRILLTFLDTVAHQKCVIDWARDHRVHHKYSETDADPHNATRGFFFAHIGWLFCRKNPEVIAKGQTIDISDLEQDPILAFQRKHYFILMPLACFVMPTVVPMLLWGESLQNAFYVAAMFRYTFVLHIIWLVNSVAHMYGNRPYDENINPSENKGVSVIALGEGWHNYHHAFPWDYKAAELGNYRVNFTTMFIDLMSKIGWAYDLKAVSPSIIKQRVERTGDGSHHTWGWGDKDQSDTERKEALIMHQKSN